MAWWNGKWPFTGRGDGKWPVTGTGGLEMASYWQGGGRRPVTGRGGGYTWT
jgi:hypothetical protein